MSLLATAEEILRLTESLTLTGNTELMEQEVEAFTQMVDKRAPLVERFVQYKKQDISPEDSAAAMAIIKKADVINRAHSDIIQGFMKTAQSTMKDIRSGRALSDAYDFYAGQETPRRFEAKK